MPTHGSLSTTSAIRAILKQLDTKEQIHCLGFRSVGSKVLWDNPPFSVTRILIPKRGERYFRFLFLPIIFLSGLMQLMLKKHKCIFVSFPDDVSLLCGYFLAVLTGKPLFPYMMDLYVETGVWAQPLDKWLQKQVFNKANRLVVINEGMQEYYHENYNIESICLPHVFPRNPYPIKELKNSGDSFTIGYSGTINGARIAGLKRLKEALKDMPNVKMLYYSPQNENYLRNKGVWSEGFMQKNITDTNELLDALSRCDALFNPVYSGKIDRAQIKTSFGGKMVEYLASGVPIIIDSDEDFFTYKFMKNNKVGVLVAHNSAISLKKSIKFLQNDPEFYYKMANSNLNLREYFSREKMNEIFNNQIIGNKRNKSDSIQ